MGHEFEFGHETLDCYQLALAVAQWAAQQALPSARRHLRDQLIRAADSMVLNIAEGSGQAPGDSRRNHYRIAMGSAAEVSAVLDLVVLADGPTRQEELRRVAAAMLAKMAQK